MSYDWHKFYDVYDRFMTGTYEEVLNDGSDKRGYGIMPELLEDLELQVFERAKAWDSTPNDEFSGKTPEEIVSGIGDLDEMIKAFRIGAVESDYDLPRSVLNRLTDFGDEAASELMELALMPLIKKPGNDETYRESDVRVAAPAVRVLGTMRPEGFFERFTEALVGSFEPEEYISDEYSGFARSYGEKAYLYMIGLLDSACVSKDEFTPAHEVILSALVRMENGSERKDVFECVRNCFRVMDNKLLGALYVGDLGNPRGIRLLKGFLDSGAADDDRELFYQILSAVRKLGGDIADVRDPFGDFV
ncbi:MAG: hypothetical protein WC102_05680 [Saccharofermentanales bacterium]